MTGTGASEQPLICTSLSDKYYLPASAVSVIYSKRNRGEKLITMLSVGKSECLAIKILA